MWVRKTLHSTRSAHTDTHKQFRGARNFLRLGIRLRVTPPNEASQPLHYIPRSWGAEQKEGRSMAKMQDKTTCGGQNW